MTMVHAVLRLALICLCGSTCAALAGQSSTVDLQLVLAADVSGSMSTAELRLQREGYVSAFLGRDVATAILSGPHGSIAVTYVEWAERWDQTIVVPWTVLDDERSIAAFARRLAAAPVVRRGSHTGLSSALLFSARLFGSSGLRSFRSTVDVSGDGVSDDGPPIGGAREALVSLRITINGLSVAHNEQHGPFAAMFGASDVDIHAYYRDEVIGGPGAFALAVDVPGDFAAAIQRKLVLEIASR